MGTKRILKSFGILALLTVIATAFYTLTKTSVTGTYSTAEFEVIGVDEKYYILLEDRELKISNDMVESIDHQAGQIYQITFSHGLFNEKGGEVLRIDLYGNTEG